MGTEEQFHEKRRSTYYTPEKAERARQNVRRYDWAREQADAAVEAADALLEKRDGPDGIWEFVTGQEIPRSCAVSDAGSPITGEELIVEHGGRSWIGDGVYGNDAAEFDGVDPPPGPWTLVDPTSGYVFPTNDFAAYRESGRDERGFFDPDLADDSLLVNERYPDKPDDWGVDDGTGWEDDDGNVYTFVAFYNHYHVWYDIRDMARAFRDAYLLSGEARFARAATVLLDRVADVYPDLDISAWPPEAPYANSHGGWGQGKAIGGMAWGNAICQSYVQCYDAVFPGQDDGAVAVLAEKADRYDVGEKSSLRAIRENVEENILKEVLPSVRDGVLRGGFGTHQRSLAWAAVVLDDFGPDGYSRDAVDFLLKAGKPRHFDDGTPWGRTIVTGGDVLPRIVDAFDRDGHYRLSVFYNRSKPGAIREIADVLDHAPDEYRPDLLSNVKVERMHRCRLPLIALNRYMPNVGDTEKTGQPVLNVDLEDALAGFELYGDSVAARAADLLAERSADLVIDDPDVRAKARFGEGPDRGLRGDVFDPDPEDLADRIAAVVEAEGPLDLPSTHHAGYGLAMLRQGSIEPRPSTKRVTWLYHGRNGGEAHNHHDALTLGLFGYELDLVPDLGYPEKAVKGYPKRTFTKGTIGHATVMVDGEDQSPHWVGEPRHYDDADRVSLVDVDATGAYPQSDTYRRTTAMVSVDADASYVVDCFRVEGGGDHRYSFHAAEGPMAAEGLDLVAQDGGTYAGEDVPLPDRGEERPYDRDVGNGFNYLDGVRRDADPPGRFAVDWDVEDTWDVRDDEAAGVGLRLTMLGDLDEVALAEGQPPQKPGAPERLGYVIARRSADEEDAEDDASGGVDLASTFCAVIEPYDGARSVESVRAVPVEATDDEAAGAPASAVGDGRRRGLRIDLADGRTDYVAWSADPDAVVEVGDAFRFDGFFAVYSERDGEPEHAYLSDGTVLEPAGAAEPLIDRDRPRIEGTVVNFTRDLARENEIVVRPDGAKPSSLADAAGSWIYVDTDRRENAAYEIEGVAVEDGLARLDVGDRTTVASFRDPDDPDAGYEYLLEEGAPFRIPLSATWRRDGGDDQ